jgi:hypothetical protein
MLPSAANSTRELRREARKSVASRYFYRFARPGLASAQGQQPANERKRAEKADERAKRYRRA